MDKYKEIFKSPRFQMLALAAIAHGLSIYKDTQDWVQALITALIELLAAATAVGTIDKFSEAKKATATNTTVSIPESVSEVTAETKKVVKKK